MTDRSASRLAWGIFAIAVAGAVGTAALTVATMSSSTGPPTASIDDAVLMIVLLAFPLVGVLIASRQPRNAIGWILLGIGIVWEIGIGLAGAYMAYAFRPGARGLAGGDLVAAAASSAWVPAVGLMAIFLPLLFPNGRLPSPRWRWLAVTSAIALGVLTIATPFRPVSLRDLVDEPWVPAIDNPLGIAALRPIEGVLDASVAVLLLGVLGAASSVVIRYRRSHGLERLQVQWLAAGAGATAFLYLVMMISGAAELWGVWTPPTWWAVLDDITVYSFVLIPVSVGVSVLRYRLYDIDVIVNRALVYAVLTTALALFYVACVLGLSALIRATTGRTSSDIVVAASTLAVAGAFGPLRRGVQSFIDRRFYRRKYDAEQTLAQFSASIRDRVDLDSLTAELIGAVAKTIQPATAWVWLRRP